MKINKFLVIPVACFALTLGLTSCNGEGTGHIQMWDWSTPAPEPEPEPEPEPDAYVEMGWTDLEDTYGALPEYIKAYKYENAINGNDVKAFMAVADIAKVKFEVLGEAEGYKTPTNFYEEANKAIIINGGFFYDGKSLSLVCRDGKVICANNNVDSPDWTETFYYMPRGVLSQATDGSFFTGWTWTTVAGQTIWYPTSMPLEAGRVPDMTYPEGAKEFSAQTAIGGGPVLVLDSKVVNSYEDEYLQINPTSKRPRTAIGIDSAKGKIIFFVCEGDGMTSGVGGMTLEEVANVFVALGCEQALNLDGGGSSCMLINGKETIKPSDGKQRTVINGASLN